MTKKPLFFAFSILITLTCSTLLCAADKDKSPKGDNLFKEKCASCHPDGGNIINAQKTLKKKDLAKNKLKNAADIVKYLRKPGPGMPAFDATVLPDKDAKAIADHILKTFK